MTPRNKRIWAIGRVVLFLLSCTFVLIATSALPPARAGKNSMLYLGLVSAAGTFLVTWVFTRWESCSMTSVGAGFNRGSAFRLAIGLLVGSAILGLHWILMYACGHVRWESMPQASPASLATLSIAFICLSAREELAFHGFALRRLHLLTGLWPAQLGIAVLFALEHIVGGTSLLNALAGAGMGSLLFGMAAMATRGLAVPIGIHAAWNIGDWLRGGKGTPGLWRAMVEPGHEPYVHATGMATYVLVMAAATFCFWLVYRARPRCADERPRP